jgi:hypothetical protein
MKQLLPILAESVPGIVHSRAQSDIFLKRQYH